MEIVIPVYLILAYEYCTTFRVKIQEPICYSAVINGSRVVPQAVRGILAQETPVIAAMAQSISRQEMDCWAAAKRLYRFMGNERFNHHRLYKGMYRVGQRTVREEHPEYLVVALDPVNFEKPYTKKLEGVSTVHKSTPPEELVPWSQRNPYQPLAGNLILDSTFIPARGFAVILSPIYTEGAFPYMMPYQFPQNTVILTAANSRTLGDDFFNLIGDGQSRDVLVLYKGGASVIQEVISTYGTPKLDSYVTGIRDDYLDNLPLDLHECSSVERISPIGPDSFDNWREISNGSPGEAPY